MDGISKSEVSRICKVRDAEVKALLVTAHRGECPYIWLDATFHNVLNLVEMPLTRASHTTAWKASPHFGGVRVARGSTSLR